MTFLWEEKYKPNSIDEIVTSNRIKSFLEGIIKSGNITNYLFVGSPGVGKTASAVALCKDLEVDYVIIDASVDNSVDFIRNNVLQMASSKPVKGDYKVLIFDEADYLSKNAQASLRNVINNTLKYARFILTANYPEKIIAPLKDSRTPMVKFEFTKEEMIKEILPALLKRLAMIFKKEGVKIEDMKALTKFIANSLPNIRFIMKTIQMNVQMNDGVLSKDIYYEENVLSVDYVKGILESDYVSMLKFVKSISKYELFEFLIDHIHEFIDDLEDQAEILYRMAMFQNSAGIDEIYSMSILLALKEQINKKN